MTLLVRALVCPLVASLSITLAAQGQIRDGRLETTGTAVLRGRVTTADTGAPLRDASVTIVWEPAIAPERDAPVPPSAGGFQPARHMLTDADGRYEFTRLVPGPYRVVATAGAYRSRYLPRGYGAKRSHDAGSPIELKAGEVANADIALVTGSAIEGRVVDEFGEPVSGVAVFAARLMIGANAPQRAPVQPAQTNDLGRYRVYGLEEGTYIVAVEGRGTANAAAAAEGPSPEGFATTFYPSSLSDVSAQKVRVPASQDLTGIDIQIVRTGRCRITGTVIDSQGRQTGANATLMRPILAGSMSTRVQVDGSGRFTARDLDPGEYTLSVQSGQTAGRLEFAEMPLNVTGDIDDLVVVTQPGATINGRIVLVDGVLPPKTTLRADLHGAQSLSRSGPRFETGVTVNDEMRFVMHDVFGPKLLRILSLPPGWTLKAVMLGQMEITDVPTEFVRQSSNEVEVLLTSKASTVEGTVIDDRGKPVRDATVYVFPEDSASWNRLSPRVAVTDAGNGGRFATRGLSAGRYFAVAVAREGFRTPNTGPEFFEVLRTEATSFVIGDDERRVVDLKLWHWPE